MIQAYTALVTVDAAEPIASVGPNLFYNRVDFFYQAHIARADCPLCLPVRDHQSYREGWRWYSHFFPRLHALADGFEWQLNLMRAAISRSLHGGSVGSLLLARL